MIHSSSKATRHTRAALTLAAGLVLPGAGAAGEVERLTLYDAGLGLVGESRTLTLSSGVTAHSIDGLPTELRPESLLVTAPPRASVVDYRWQPAVQNEADLLSAFVGRTVTLRPATGSGAAETRGELLAVLDGVPLVATDDGVERITPDGPWRLALPPEAARDALGNTLRLRLDAKRAGAARVGLDYLVGGLAWDASYTLHLAPDGTARLAGTANLANSTETDFQTPAITLISGQINDAGGGAPRPEMAMMRASAPPGPAAEAIGDWHLYRLDTAVRLPARSTVSVPLVAMDDLSTRRLYETRGEAGMTLPEGEHRVPVHTVLTLPPRGADAPPLPAGRMQVISNYAGAARFLGADRIPHSPGGEAVELALGEAFDLVARRTRTAFRRLDEGRYDVAWQITVRNDGPEPATVSVKERVPGDWRLLEGEGWTQVGNDLLRRELTVPARGSAATSYRVRVTP